MQEIQSCPKQPHRGPAYQYRRGGLRQFGESLDEDWHVGVALKKTLKRASSRLTLFTLFTLIQGSSDSNNDILLVYSSSTMHI